MDWFRSFLRTLGIEKGLVNITTANIISSLISGVFWLYLASIINAKDYGQLNYFLSIAMTASTVSIMGLNVTVMTFLPKGNEILKKQANRFVLLSNCIIIIPLALIIFHLPTLLLVISLSFFIMEQSGLLGERKYKKYSYVTIGQRVLLVVLSLLLYYVMNIDGIIIGYAISSLIFCFSYYKSLTSFDFNFKEIKSNFQFTMHSFSINLSDKIAIYVDKLLIGPLLGLDVLGLYQLGFQFFLFLTLLPISVNQFLLPREAAGIERGKIVALSMMGAVLCSVIIFLIIPNIITSFFPNYVTAIKSAQIMVFGIIPYTASTIIGTRLFGRGKSKPVFIGALLRVISLTILIIFLGRSFGLFGLALSILISLTIQFIALLIISKSLLKDNTKDRQE